MVDPPYVLCALVQMLVRVGVGLGLDRAELLAEAGLSEDELADRDAQILLAKQVALGVAIARRRPGANLALKVLEQYMLANLGVLGYAIQHCRTLRDALELFVRCQRLLSNAAHWSLDPPGERLTVVTTVGNTAAITMLGQWVVLTPQLSTSAPPPRELRFVASEPAGGSREFTDLFGCPVVFEADHNELRFARGALDVELSAARPAMLPGLVALVETQIGAGPDDFRRRLGDGLRASLARASCTKEEVARALGMSGRTLSRRLQSEGTTFRAELNRARCEFAKACLARDELAVYEIALLLGYSEPSAFFRAFRNWTGTTPSEWRSEGSDIRFAGA